MEITDIASFAFEDNQTLNSIILPINLISIGECAFKYCKNLTSVTLPDSVEEIGRYAFADCIELTTFTFGSNCQLQVISDGAFENCAKLSSIEIPKSVATVGVRAFYGCKELQSLTFESNSSLKDIQAYSFFNCAKLVLLNMPNTVETIGNYAFYGCVKVSDLVFGTNFDSKIKTIGEYAFNGANITSLDFGKYLELEYIGEYSFTTCGSATVLILPNHALTIKLNAFNGCNGVTQFYCQTTDIWALMEDNDLTNGEFYMNNTAITKPTVTRYYYSETQPVDKTKNYWHYVGNEISIW